MRAMHRNLEGWECGVWQRMSLHFLGRVLHQPQPVPGQVDGASERVLASGGHIAQTGLGVGGWKLELPLEEWGPWFAHL